MPFLRSSPNAGPHRSAFRAPHDDRRQSAKPRAYSLVERLEGRLLLSAYIVTNNLDSGPGSLRADIQMSNATQEANTIAFAPGLSGTITLTSGQLEITSDLTITGPGADSVTISGNKQSRVFQIDAGVTASISGLTITGGRAPAGSPGADAPYGMTGGAGGPGADGGGIYSLGSLTLSSDSITNNSAGTGGNGGSGSDVHGFWTPGGAGGRGGNGGGIYSAGPLTIIASTIDSNSAGDGGSAGMSGRFVPEQAGSGGDGGGVWAGANVVMTDSTISNNRAGDANGGIQSSSGGSGGSGGGVFASAGITFANSTIALNLTGADTGAFQPPGIGAGIDSVGPVHLTNCTVSSGVVGDVVAGGNSVLNNTIDRFFQGSLDPSSSNNLVSPRSYDDLAQLGNYGGPTQTMPPLPGSDAIDAGSNALAIGPDGKPLLTDQRGFPRIVNALHKGTPTVDIGAAEGLALPTSPLAVATTVQAFDPNYSSLSLSEALEIADLLGGPEMITFRPGLTGTIASGGRCGRYQRASNHQWTGRGHPRGRRRPISHQRHDGDHRRP